MFQIFKSKLFWIILSILIMLTVGLLVVLGKVEQKKIEDAKCKFSLDEIIENRHQKDRQAYTDERTDELREDSMVYGGINLSKYISRYTPAKHETYFDVASLLKNNSEKRQYLNGMILKIYTKNDENILLAESYENVKDWIEPNQSYPFQITAVIDRTNTVLNKYFDKDDEVRIDLYPHFSSCDY